MFNSIHPTAGLGFLSSQKRPYVPTLAEFGLGTGKATLLLRNLAEECFWAAQKPTRVHDCYPDTYDNNRDRLSNVTITETMVLGH